MKKILITGARGMLGRSLLKCWKNRFELVPVDLDEVDITDGDATMKLVKAIAPEAIVHCAAMTAVDACEGNREAALRVNRDGSAHVAEAARAVGARLIAISTDYVFSGAGARPWRVDDRPDPKTVYGWSKWLGEEKIRRILPDRHLIARTAWLYGPGGPSFVHTMLKLAAEHRPALKVVNDQFGSPTSTAALGGGLEHFIGRPDLAGTFHLSCEGACSWYDFAVEIFRQRGIEQHVTPCATAEFPRPAPRPAYSVLDKSELARHRLPPMPEWKAALSAFWDEETP